MSEVIEQPKRRVPAFFGSDGFVMLCIYAGVFIVHILMTLCTTIFNLTPDEFSVTAVAALANGLNWESIVSTGGYYGYFQSIFYIPVFQITDDPYMRYRLMLVINGILMSAAPVIIYYLARRKFEVKKAASVLFAVICGMYPCYMLLTKYTWNETMCNLLPWVFLLLMYKSMDCSVTWKKQVFSVLGGLTLVAAYATHGRMLSLLAAGFVLVLLVYFTMNRTRVFCFTGFYAAIVAGFIGDKMLKGYLQGILWNAGEGKTPANTIEKMMTRLFANDGLSLERFFDTLVGHFFYFLSATWGFGAICVVAVIAAIVLYFKRRNAPVKYDEQGNAIEGSGPYLDDKSMVFCLFTLLAMGAIFVVSVCFKATSTLYEQRMDTVMYGRYTEVFYPIAIFAGLLLIYKGKLSFLQTFGALVFTAVINVLTQVFVVPVVLNGKRFVCAMIMNIAPLRFGEGMKELFTQESFVKIMAATSVVVFAWFLVRFIRRSDSKPFLFFAVPMVCLLTYSGVYDYINYTVPQAKTAETGARYVREAMEGLEDDMDSLAFVALARDKEVKAQFIYPELETEVVSSFAKLALRESYPQVMLAAREESLDLWLDGVYRVGDINNTLNLFTSSEEFAQLARDKGLRVSEGNGHVVYTAAELPSTTSVIKEGLPEDADLSMADSAFDEITALLPNGSAVYTNYFHAQTSGKINITVYGTNVDSGKITLTAEKGDRSLEYEIISADADKLVISFSVSKKTENIRFKLTNNSAVPIGVTSLEIERAGSVNSAPADEEQETDNDDMAD